MSGYLGDEIRKIVREFLEFTPSAANVRLPESIEVVERETQSRKVVPLVYYIRAMYVVIGHNMDLFAKVGDRWIASTADDALDGQPLSNAQLIFSMLGVYDLGRHCNFWLRFTADPTLDLGEGELVETIPGTRDSVETNRYLERIDSIAGTFHADIEKCQDRLVAIPVSTWEKDKEGHRNMLVVMKMRPDRYFVLKYEPNGYEDDTEHPRLRNHLLENLQMALSKVSSKYVWLPMQATSCPIGLQRVSTAKIGYCVMFSNFWLYCLLRCFPLLIRLQQVESFQRAVHSIEQIILDEVDPGSLSLLVTNFAIRYCDKFFELVQLNSHLSDLFYREVVQLLISDDGVNEGTRDGGSPFTMNSFYDRVDDEKVEHAMDVDEKERQPDGAHCVKNEDCLSHCCRDQKCKAVDFDREPTYGEVKEVTEEEYSSMVEALFRNAVNFVITPEARIKARRLFLFSESCVVNTDEKSDPGSLEVYKLITFFFPENVVHSICNGSFVFDWLTGRLATQGTGFKSIDSNESMDELARQVLHRRQFNCQTSIVAVSVYRARVTEMPYQLFLLNRFGLFGFNVNESEAYMKPFSKLGENLAHALTRSGGVEVKWQGWMNLQFEGLHARYDQTLRHMVNGLSLAFFVQFGDRYESLHESVSSFVGITLASWDRYKSRAEEIVCKFARDLLNHHGRFDSECAEEIFEELKGEADSI